MKADAPKRAPRLFVLAVGINNFGERAPNPQIHPQRPIVVNYGRDMVITGRQGDPALDPQKGGKNEMDRRRVLTRTGHR
jgi:hypothetical protein